jgi:membrane protein
VRQILPNETLHRLPYLLRRTLFASFEDGLFTIAKGAAYSALLSFFPILTTVATIFVQARAEYVRQRLLAFLAQVLPPGTEEVVMQQAHLRGQRPVALLIAAIVLALWAASSVFKSLIDGFNAAYHVPRNRSVLAHQWIGMMLALLSLAPLAGASSLILFGGTVESAVLRTIKIDPLLNPLAPGWQLLSRVTRYAIAFGATSTLTAILYYYGPYRKQRWRRVWPGAFLATILWLLATLAFAWYVRNITNYNLLYGSIGTSIALLVWMYLLAAIALFGCEFNAENERMMVMPVHARDLD